ncbi:hypothetical protein NLJ89_g9522 [Agrocybe chaxingu]|uniref:Aminotransferase class I/classII large domain-containing protein n=1 Tax=Agrocybe chaxingu TaxID=84603 RepID=A0A9W8JSW0_9AGAR|nr:hypothetical protein NLJ89_g9522 [Agrocybe chaxingu]
MSSEKSMTFGDAIDLSHHLSTLSRNRVPSPLKELQKYWGRPGIISLAGGLPSPEYFPFDAVKADGLFSSTFPATTAPQAKSTFSWLWDIFSASKVATTPITIPKFPEHSNDINLATYLQYSTAEGQPHLLKIVNELTTKVYKPAYANFQTMLHAGNTDGWLKAVNTLCNDGEGVLTDEWTYPSAIASMKPYGVNPVPVAMDGQGMSSIALREVLSSWDEKARRMPRPHVMYIVPVGQNPTGATMLSARKKEIYDICVEYDIIIVEDDPYYFMQEGPYVAPSRRTPCGTGRELGDEEYINSLAPSFLRFDYQGRVVRLDTFSKTIAPGCRLGWYTCNPLFAERLLRQAETSTQAPCGFGQSIVASLLIDWQYSGYLRWLKGLGSQYRLRRDFFIDCLASKFHLEFGSSVCNRFTGSLTYVAYSKLSRHGEKFVKKPLFSFMPPSSGMFVWLRFDFEGHPKVEELGPETLEKKLWIAMAEGGLLIGAGSIFAANPTDKTDGTVGHFRISFSNTEFDALKKAVDIMAQVLDKFYQDL